MTLKKETWIEKLVTDVNSIPSLEVISGYIGSAQSEDYIRIYQNENLSSYIEVAKSNIVYSEERNKKDFPLGGSIVWVNKNSEISISHNRGKSLNKGQFLSGGEGIETESLIGIYTSYNCPKPKMVAEGLTGIHTSGLSCPTNKMIAEGLTGIHTSGLSCKDSKMVAERLQTIWVMCTRPDMVANSPLQSINTCMCPRPEMANEGIFTGFYCSKVVQHTYCCEDAGLMGNNNANPHTYNNTYSCGSMW